MFKYVKYTLPEGKMEIQITVTLTLVITLLGFSDYIFGNKLFFGSAHDMINPIFPSIVEMHHQLYDGESLMWSFFRGLGSPIAVGNPNNHGDIFAWILAAFPIDFMPKAIIYVHILKFLCASGLFYAYLSLFKSLGSINKIIGSLLYSCSGVMLCRGAWFHYATEIVMIVPFLIGLEKWYRNHKSLFIVPAFAMLILSRFATYACIYTIYAFAYIVLRTLFDYKLSLLMCLKNIRAFAVKYFISLCLASISLIPGVIVFFNSARSGALNFILTLNSIETITANFLKFFQPNITGLFETGIINILEDLSGYSGIVTILLCMGLFFGTGIDRYHKTFFLTILGLIIVFLLPACIVAEETFTISYYKSYNLWINIILIVIGVYLLEHLRFQHMYIAGGAILTGFCFAVYKYKTFGKSLISGEIVTAIIFIMMYSLIFAHYQKKLAPYLLLSVVCLELGMGIRYSAKQTSGMAYLSQYDIWTDYSYRYKSLGNMSSDANFNRKAVIHNYVFTMHGEMNRYFGFDRYESVNNKEMVEFTDLFFNDCGDLKNHVMLGLSSYRGLRNMLSAKYICDDRGKNFSDSLNDFIINDNFVPLGYLYKYQISIDELQRYPTNIRDDIFSKAGIVTELLPELHKFRDDFIIQKICEYMAKIEKTNDLKPINNGSISRYLITGTDPWIIFDFPSEAVSANDILTIDLDMTIKRKNNSPVNTLRYQIFYAGDDGEFSEKNSFYSSTRNGKALPYLNEYITPNIRFLRVDIGIPGQTLNVGDVKLSTYRVEPKDPSVKYTPYAPLDKDSVCTLEKFSSTDIRLRANNDEPRLLFLGIPYDKGWSLYDNGKEIEVMRVNVGFMGTYLAPGEHELILKYRTPGLYEGAAISGATAIGLLVIWLRRRKEQSEDNAA